jgi:hypothetical protein
MNPRRRHPSDREFSRYPLNRIVLAAVTEALCWCGGPRPDSSRQGKAKARAKELARARALKAAPIVVVAPPDLSETRLNRFSW